MTDKNTKCNAMKGGEIGRFAHVNLIPSCNI